MRKYAPPGTGKTMLAKRIPSILPLMTREEALETTRTHCVSGEHMGMVHMASY